VVTREGLPQEFLYSGPLRPTPVQAILYQDRLLPQVRLALVRALLRGLRSRLVFVSLRAAEIEREVLAELRVPLIILQDGAADWASPPSESAGAFHSGIEEVVGVVEPMGRAAAALAYVAEFERSAEASS
jgi:hypothetical protein